MILARLGLLMGALLIVGVDASAQEDTEVIHARGSVVFRTRSKMTKAWTTTDGLPSNEVNALAQSQDGYLWVGTTGGLARFDGVRFVTYGEKEGIPLIPIKKLVALPDGRLWILNVAQGSYWLNNGKFVKDSRNIIELEIGKDGKIYAYDGKVIFILDDQSGEKIEIPSPEPQIPSHAKIAVTKDGTLWLFQASFISSKVWVWKNNAWNEWRGYTAVSDTNLIGLYCLQSAADGSVWFGDHANKMIGIGENGHEKWVSLPGTNLGTYAVAEDKEGSLWIARYDGSFYCYKKGTLIPHPLTDNRQAIKAIAFGMNGEIWAGTDSGGLLRNQVCPVKHRQKGLPEIKVAALAVEETGHILVGTSGQGLFRWCEDGSVIDVLGTEDKNRHIISLLPMEDETLWIGGSWGLHQYQGGKRLTTDSFAKMLAEPKDSVSCILQTKDKSIWLGTRSGSLRVVKDNRVEEIPLKEKIAINDLETDSVGNIWAATQRKRILIVAPDRSYHYLGKDNGIPEATLATLYRDSHQIMWLGTEGAGLYFWRDGRFHLVATPDEKELGNSLQIEEDDDGWIWVGTTHGICGVNVSQIRKGGTAPTELLWLGEEDGIANEQCTQMEAIKDSSGRLYFGTMKGFVSFDPRKMKRPSSPPNVVIEEIRGENMWPTVVAARMDKPEIPAGSRFTVRLTGLPPERAHSMRFRYRLSGLNSAWTELGSRRFVDFPYTPPGDYRLEVQGGVRGKWHSNVAALDMHVRPFYWQTWWFKMILVALGLLAVVLLMKGLERRRMRHVLAALERERAVNEERDRIARDLHDGLGAGLTQANILVEEWGKPESAVRIKDRLRSLARELDNAVWLTDSTYDRLPAVCDYLATYAQNWFRDTGLRCFLDLPSQIPDIQIPQETRQHLFQAVKECLNNVLKHAKATEVNFSLHTSKQIFV